MKHRAFSLLEVLFAVSVVGILGSFVYGSFEDFSQRAARQKLESDVDTLNRAVASYLAMGGSLNGAETPSEVIAQLQSKASSSMEYRLPGLSSRFVDSRLAVIESPDKIGVIWDANQKRLVLDEEGEGAVAAFVLDESLAEIPAQAEARNRIFSYAEESTWIWDYRDRERSHSPGATEMVVVGNTPDVMPAATPTPVAPSHALQPPRVSHPGRSYPISSFDLPISLTNPNPAGSSRIVYAIDYGNWQEYTGPVLVSPGTVLSAQAIANDAVWSDSAKRDEEYEARSAQLKAPQIEPNHPTFGVFFHREITVGLTNPNPENVSKLEYRIDGGDWMPYTTPFNLQRSEHGEFAEIDARAMAVDTLYYVDSELVSRVIEVDPFKAQGETKGRFENASGSQNMTTSLGGEDPANTFAWGEVLPVNAADSTPQSRLGFEGNQFTGIAPDQKFQIGHLTYYNGTIVAGTGADRVDLNIQLNLTIDDVFFQPDFAFSFELVNTVNGRDPWDSADYVRITNPHSMRNLVINDYEYQFEIEFGRTTSRGYALFDEFHVQEDARASAEIYGSLREVRRFR